MSHLSSSPTSYLTSLMNAFHNGDIKQFKSILSANSASFRSLVPEFDEEEMISKVLLSSLSCLVFQTPSQERLFTYQAIQDRLGDVDVELVIMRAMSEGLIQGSMNQVNETAELTWVMVGELNDVDDLNDSQECWIQVKLVI